MGKDAFYFSHDSNAISDEKIQCLLADHGMAGYGLYWALVERMFESKETNLNHKLLRGLAFSLNVDITLLSSVIATCIDVKLFISEGDYFYSESLRRRKRIWEDSKQKKSAAGKLGMAKRWAIINEKSANQQLSNTVITPDNTVVTPDNKGNKRKGNKRVYTHPAVEEVENYFLENGYTKEAGRRAWKYYDTTNWVDSEGKPVRSWKQKMQGVWFKPENLATDTNPKARKIEMVL